MAGRSAAKKEALLVKALKKDMKKKGPKGIERYFSGTTPPPPRRAPKPPQNKSV